ncbi:MAG: MFS transporter [Chloroflexi bacterium]|nr:MFS transporter [Chloroflexota bacterium]
MSGEADITKPRSRLAGFKAGVGAPFASLAVPNFRYLWFGQVGSATAMHADMLARSWLAWQITGSFTAVAGVNVARGIPQLIFGLAGGVVADRFDRRKTLMIIQAWTFTMYAVMAALILLDFVELWHVYAIAFLQGISMSMNQPIRTSVVPQLVGKDKMLNAISLNSIAINGTRFVGPAAVAFIIGFWGVGSAYVLSAAVYVLVLWTTTKIKFPDIPGDPKKRGSAAGQLMEGFRFIAKDRMILTLVLLGLGPFAIGIAHRSLLPGLITEVLESDVEMLGILQSVAAIGSLGAGLYIASHTNIPRKGTLMLVVTVAYGASLLAMGWASLFWVVMPLLIVGAMSQTVFRAANTTLLLERTPDRLRGRVVSVTLIDQALSPVVGIAAGVIADAWGVGSGFAFLGIAILAVVALAMAVNPGFRKI